MQSWLTLTCLSAARSFLQNFNQALCPGAKVVLIDNRFVEGGNTPISKQDTDGNTYQIRSLADGSKHCVMKNFLRQVELLEAVAGIAEDVCFHEWQYFWALEYCIVVLSPLYLRMLIGRESDRSQYELATLQL